MKSTIIRTGAAIALGLLTGVTLAPANTSDSNSGNSTPQNETTMQKIENGTANAAKGTVHETKRLAHSTMNGTRDVAHATASGTKSFASSTWDESKKIGDTVVHSPVIAWQVMRGERPLFPKETASSNGKTHEQIAFGGHRKPGAEIGKTGQ